MGILKDLFSINNVKRVLFVKRWHHFSNILKRLIQNGAFLEYRTMKAVKLYFLQYEGMLLQQFKLFDVKWIK